MASVLPSDPTPSAWAEALNLSAQVPEGGQQLLVLGLALIVAVAFVSRALAGGASKYPLINPSTGWEFFGTGRSQDFQANASRMMQIAKDKFPGQTFRIMTDNGERLILPSKWAHHIRNEPNLSFMKATSSRFHAHIPGFEPFAVGNRGDALMQVIARKQLTKLLSKVTLPLSQEADLATNLRFGTSTKWREVILKDDLLDVVARLSSRVFLGEEMCRNEAWLNITKMYTINAFIAAEGLRLYPKWARPIVHWFLPECQALRRQQEEAKELVSPAIEKRRAICRKAVEEGKPVPRFNDAIEWAEEEAQGRPYEPAVFQIVLSLAAIHTTTDLATETLLRLLGKPELIQELRQEMVDVLGTEGWKKTSLYNLQLLDSVLKEAQRMKPITIAVMEREAMGNVTLPDGTVLRKGTDIAVDTFPMTDPAIHENPEEFDGHRFLRTRSQPGKESQAHLVSTSPVHLGFGHGQHACPGRFFAANELKVMMCHLLMKYDWELAPGCVPKVEYIGFSASSDRMARVRVKRRLSPEIDLDAIKAE